MPKIISIILTVLLSISATINIFQFSRDRNRDLYLVKTVIDGDTIQLDNNRKVRLAGVEAPEVGFCGNQEATDLLNQLVKNKKVRIGLLVTDSYGREVANIYVGDTFINKEIIASGWATYNSKDIADREEVKKLHQEVQEAKRGVYGLKCTQTENPDNPKCIIKGNISEGHKSYLFPGCTGYYRANIQLHLGESWFCSEKEAEAASFTKNTNCYNKSF